MWPNEIPIGYNGQVQAVAAPRDVVGPSSYKFAMLLTHRTTALKTYFAYAVLLNGKTFETVAEYEIRLSNEDSLVTDSNSIYYRQDDDVLFVCTKKVNSDDDVDYGLVIIHDAS